MHVGTAIGSRWLIQYSIVTSKYIQECQFRVKPIK